MPRNPDEDDSDNYFEFLTRSPRRGRQRDSLRTRKALQRRAQILEASAASVHGPWGRGGEFETTYRPGRFEEGWLMESLQSFYEDGLIVDVLAQVKGGKEANVYLCQANPDTGMDLLAAKVYRPRKLRNLRNDVRYREGREILSDEGGILKRSDSRAMRAMKNKTALGAQMLHQSWILFEYRTLEKLHALGAQVPKPVSGGSNAILMEFIGNARMAAPILHSVRLEAAEATRLFQVVLANAELMLGQGLIHGDLSSFNILYWEGRITLIDFPQVTMAHSNRGGYEILKRDVLRVCEYFRKQGVASDPAGIAERLWQEYLGEQPGFQLLEGR